MVAVVAPWNYPYLTAVNAVLPALIAGNAVILKHSHQTPLCAERFLEAFASAGVPAGVFQYLHLSHADTARLMGDRRIANICVTGSVSGGRATQSGPRPWGLATVGLELGGKDPSYVRSVAYLGHAVESLTDGALQCRPVLLAGIKRNLRGSIALRSTCRRRRRPAWRKSTGWAPLLDPQTTIDPVVRTSAAEAVRAQARGGRPRRPPADR